MPERTPCECCDRTDRLVGGYVTADDGLVLLCDDCAAALTLERSSPDA